MTKGLSLQAQRNPETQEQAGEPRYPRQSHKPLPQFLPGLSQKSLSPSGKTVQLFGSPLTLRKAWGMGPIMECKTLKQP